MKFKKMYGKIMFPDFLHATSQKMNFRVLLIAGVALGLALVGVACESSNTNDGAYKNSQLFGDVKEHYGQDQGLWLPDQSTTKKLLESLEVTKKAKLRGYSRDQFGQAWETPENPQCNTRNRVLKRDLTDVKFQRGKGGATDCVVRSGTLDGPYSGRIVDFSRNNTQSVQIDHVVALADAWKSGANMWNSRKRQQFANDMSELLAVTEQTNDDKGSRDAAQWLPPDQNYHCSYATRQVMVKANYELIVTQQEKQALSHALETCS